MKRKENRPGGGWVCSVSMGVLYPKGGGVLVCPKVETLLGQ
jgi:hypothetical protein